MLSECAVVFADERRWPKATTTTCTAAVVVICDHVAVMMMVVDIDVDVVVVVVICVSGSKKLPLMMIVGFVEFVVHFCFALLTTTV